MCVSVCVLLCVCVCVCLYECCQFYSEKLKGDIGEEGRRRGGGQERRGGGGEKEEEEVTVFMKWFQGSGFILFYLTDTGTGLRVLAMSQRAKATKVPELFLYMTTGVESFQFRQPSTYFLQNPTPSASSQLESHQPSFPPSVLQADLCF